MSGRSAVAPIARVCRVNVHTLEEKALRVHTSRSTNRARTHAHAHTHFRRTQAHAKTHDQTTAHTAADSREAGCTGCESRRSVHR